MELKWLFGSAAKSMDVKHTVNRKSLSNTVEINFLKQFRFKHTYSN